MLRRWQVSSSVRKEIVMKLVLRKSIKLGVFRLILFVAALFMICSTVRPHKAALAQSDKATVYIYKGWHVATLWRAAFSVFCNDKEIARLDRGIYLVAKLSPGKYEFHTKNKKAGGVTLDVKAGSVYYLRMDTESGTQVTNARLSIVPAEQAEYDLKQMKPIDDNDIKDRSIVESASTPMPTSKPKPDGKAESKPSLAPEALPLPTPTPRKLCYESGHRIPCP